MFTAVIIDNDFGDFMEIKRAINAIVPHTSIDGVFSFNSAITLVGVLGKITDDIPSVGVFVIEAQLRDGSPVSIIRLIKSTESLRNIPIFIYTGTDDAEAKKECLIAGADKVFLKSSKSEGTKKMAVLIGDLARNKD